MGTDSMICKVYEYDRAGEGWCYVGDYEEASIDFADLEDEGAREVVMQSLLEDCMDLDYIPGEQFMEVSHAGCVIVMDCFDRPWFKLKSICN